MEFDTRPPAYAVGIVIDTPKGNDLNHLIAKASRFNQLGGKFADGDLWVYMILGPRTSTEMREEIKKGADSLGYITLKGSFEIDENDTRTHSMLIKMLENRMKEDGADKYWIFDIDANVDGNIGNNFKELDYGAATF